MSDASRPKQETMRRMCDVLGVPAEEGLALYTANKLGRPERFHRTTEAGTETTPEREARNVKTEVPVPRLAAMIVEKMDERGVTILDLAKKLDLSYEHTRRIVRGMIPSRRMLKAICEELKLPYKQVLDLANADKITEKYGELPAVMAGKKPGMEPLERVWDDLNEDQQRDLIVIAQGWAMRTRARRALEHETNAERHNGHDTAEGR